MTHLGIFEIESDIVLDATLTVERSSVDGGLYVLVKQADLEESSAAIFVREADARELAARLVEEYTDQHVLTERYALPVASLANLIRHGTLTPEPVTYAPGTPLVVTGGPEFPTGVAVVVVDGPDWEGSYSVRDFEGDRAAVLRDHLAPAMPASESAVVCQCSRNQYVYCHASPCFGGRDLTTRASWIEPA